LRKKSCSTPQKVLHNIQTACVAAAPAVSPLTRRHAQIGVHGLALGND
jgi:hypothetical protein